VRDALLDPVNIQFGYGLRHLVCALPGPDTLNPVYTFGWLFFPAALRCRNTCRMAA
jgi:hypothetical protein